MIHEQAKCKATNVPEPERVVLWRMTDQKAAVRLSAIS
jgi:hypothetical protein